MAPYLLTTTGARLFDHNRVPGDLDSYVLDQAGGWHIGEDAAVCGNDVVVPRALDFQVGYRTQQRGALVAGQPVSITYALERLTTCRGTHNGFPAWDLRGLRALLAVGRPGAGHGARLRRAQRRAFERGREVACR